MGIKRFSDITIGELLEMKKISKMTFKEAIPKMIELKEKHGWTDKETKNIVCIARDFKTTMVIG